MSEHVGDEVPHRGCVDIIVILISLGRTLAVHGVGLLLMAEGQMAVVQGEMGMDAWSWR